MVPLEPPGAGSCVRTKDELGTGTLPDRAGPATDDDGNGGEGVGGLRSRVDEAEGEEHLSAVKSDGHVALIAGIGLVDGVIAGVDKVRRHITIGGTEDDSGVTEAVELALGAGFGIVTGKSQEGQLVTGHETERLTDLGVGGIGLQRHSTGNGAKSPGGVTGNGHDQLGQRSVRDNEGHHLRQGGVGGGEVTLGAGEYLLRVATVDVVSQLETHHGNVELGEARLGLGSWSIALERVVSDCLEE